MAVSKKPRHKRRPKSFLSPFRMRKEDFDKMHKDFMKFEMLCELTLPTGRCSDDDIQCVRDFFNLCIISLALPGERSWLVEDAVEYAQKLGSDAIKAIGAVIIRGEERGTYVCKADELNVIREFAAVAGEVLHMSIDKCPRRLVKEYLAMKDLLREKQGSLQIHTDVLKQAIARY